MRPPDGKDHRSSIIDSIKLVIRKRRETDRAVDVTQEVNFGVSWVIGRYVVFGAGFLGRVAS